MQIEGGCGRQSTAWVLVDEVCAGTDAADYLDAFRAPMFRDGVRVGDYLYVVDASHLWVLDAEDPEALERVALVGGLGHPLAVAEHDGQLLVAAGEEGLILVDITSPALPVVKAQIDLGGPALGVRMDGDTAIVAAGAAGVAVVDAVNFTLTATHPVPGFAASAVARDGLVYVAACDRLAIVSQADGSLIGSTWVDKPYVWDFLVAPAKDIELVDSVAFVAAGRYGAVTIQIDDPAQPKVFGHCTVPDDLSFYASGVRASSDRLFVAGGEWGILVPASYDCTGAMPRLPKYPGPGANKTASCTQDPPWTVVPWQELWAPPAPAKDPIQVLPHESVVYAFGDARRVGTRAVDIRAQEDLSQLGRYDEPRLALDIAAHGDRVLVLGQGGALFVRDPQQLLVLAEPLPQVGSIVAGAFVADGRWVLARDNGIVFLEGGVGPYFFGAQAVTAHGIATLGNDVIVPTPTGALVWDADSQVNAALAVDTPLHAELPSSVAAFDETIFLAAPEWTRTVAVTGGKVIQLPAHQVFDGKSILDPVRWLSGVPRRLLAPGKRGLVEVATLGDAAGLKLHSPESPPLCPLPPGTYSAADTLDDFTYVVSFDRGTYRSQLLTVALAGPQPAIVDTRAFTGVATDVEAIADRLYVADADRGVRVFQLVKGLPTPLGVVELQESMP